MYLLENPYGLFPTTDKELKRPSLRLWIVFLKGESQNFHPVVWKKEEQLFLFLLAYNSSVVTIFDIFQPAINY